MDTARPNIISTPLKEEADSDSHGGEVTMDTEAGVMREGMQAGTLAVLEAGKQGKMILPWMQSSWHLDFRTFGSPEL